MGMAMVIGPYLGEVKGEVRSTDGSVPGSL